MAFTSFPTVGPYSPTQLTAELNNNFADAQAQINTKANISNPTFTGRVSTPFVVKTQATPTSKSTAATLTVSEVLASIIQYTGSADNLTLPLGTSLETAFTPALAVNDSFDISIINTGSGAVTLLVNTGVTSIGNLVVSNGTSACFRIRKTASNTFIIYRIS